MYKVLIVDDESWVVESLKASVDWNSLGFEVAGEAYSGLEALAFIQAHKPQVVFTDIRMQGMSGLELIKKGGELPDPPKFVVVSGYAEFAYAQRALNYGAAMYCLKPYDEQEIADVLSKLKKHLDAAQQLSDTLLLQMLAEEGGGSPDAIKREFDKHGIRIDAGHAVGAMVCDAGDGRFPQVEHALRLKIGIRKMLYIMAYDSLTEAARKLEAEWPDGLKGAGVSFAFTDSHMLKNAMGSANLLASHYFITGSEGVNWHREASQGTLNKVIKQIGSAIGSKEFAVLGGLFDEAGRLFQQEGYTVKHALRLYNVVISLLYSMNEEERDGMLFSYEQLMETFRSLPDMLDYLKGVSMRMIRKNPEYAVKETGNETFKLILQDVHDNFRSDISIQSLTQKYFISPNYVSQLFKKEVGETFTSYMTKLRINYACELLEQTNYLVNEIAEKAGYHDYFYFTRMFKKMTGRTPTQFREQSGT
ncbi:response regulator transcription factor [Paenibacillus spongiae]|uniref:Response regulator n=1 Tax=Paenibacillus spongiae TaxID=2909671 RepID=A0ABY5SCZ0_9BACL|nr:helix-turn-helix domain-containing protein [Paenibacillus spongiae]UVI30163.1 response regulator [Paenibacillus spongiae]